MFDVLQISELHDEFLSSVDNSLVGEYGFINNSIYDQELRYIIIIIMIIIVADINVVLLIRVLTGKLAKTINSSGSMYEQLTLLLTKVSSPLVDLLL